MTVEEGDDFDLPEEETPPENLQKKWDKEDFEDEFGGKQTLPCPHCGKRIDKRSFSCLYCCERVFFKSGLLGRFANMAPGGTAALVFILIVLTVLVFHFAF